MPNSTLPPLHKGRRKRKALIITNKRSQGHQPKSALSVASVFEKKGALHSAPFEFLNNKLLTIEINKPIMKNKLNLKYFTVFKLGQKLFCLNFAKNFLQNLYIANIVILFYKRNVFLFFRL